MWFSSSVFWLPQALWRPRETLKLCVTDEQWNFNPARHGGYPGLCLACSGLRSLKMLCVCHINLHDPRESSHLSVWGLLWLMVRRLALVCLGMPKKAWFTRFRSRKPLNRFSSAPWSIMAANGKDRLVEIYPNRPLVLFLHVRPCNVISYVMFNSGSREKKSGRFRPESFEEFSKKCSKCFGLWISL